MFFAVQSYAIPSGLDKPGNKKKKKKKINDLQATIICGAQILRFLKIAYFASTLILRFCKILAEEKLPATNYC